MKIGAKRDSLFEVEDDDDDFLAQVIAAETTAVSTKRRKVTNATANLAEVRSLTNSREDDVQGVYLAALKGNQSFLEKITGSDPRRGMVAKSVNKVVATGNNGVFAATMDHKLGGGDSCFKCGKSGHFARDCNASGGGGSYGNLSYDSSIAEKPCPCGLGTCIVLTANTEKNQGRKFYKCPLRQENGGCNFFEWCDSTSGTNCITDGGQTHAFNPSCPDVMCPCGTGSCSILTAKSGRNIGQQFYCCPANQATSCGFFKWCNEHTIATSSPMNALGENSIMNNANNKSYALKNASSCFKCGKEGHWAKDCSVPSSNSFGGVGVRSASGTCYKCGKPGHWAKDCPTR